MDLTNLVIISVCLALGGVLKGATGAGAPILAVPAIAMLFDVRLAVLVMVVPNVLTNAWQAWRFRHDRLSASFLWPFTLAGAAGAIAGTIALANFSSETLSLIVAFAVLAYIIFRLARPDWLIPLGIAKRLSVPAGLVAGLLQGASGVSAPASLTFLNAMRLQRPTFIATVSFFFVVMTAVQTSALGVIGMLTPGMLLVSLAAVIPILAFMPVGAAAAKRLSKEVFDRVILALLGFMALKLAFDAIA